ncbi:MAG TPA: hypothetical protein VFZ29_08560 [Solirubrobacterales bacterium]
MADVTRALLLPDLEIPSDQLVKTLALYWDEIVIPEYLDRAGVLDKEEVAPRPLSGVSEALASAGVIRVEKREVELPPVAPEELPEGLRDLPAPSEAIKRIVSVGSPMLELAKIRNSEERDPEQGELKAAVEQLRENIVDYAARQYLERVRDSISISSVHHLAPVSRSVVSHVASIVGAPSEAPRTEAALLSTAIQAFEVAPDTPVDRIIEFREKNALSVGRFRASLADLSEGLRKDADPTQLLAEARDRYRNRVVPALGELEEVLKQGNVQFLVRSLLGATAIALSPIDPVRAVDGGAKIVGQTINYSFSREKIVREHPFGYLHQVSKAFESSENTSSVRALEEAIEDPEKKVREMFVRDLRDSPLLDEINSGFWWGRKASNSDSDEDA